MISTLELTKAASQKEGSHYGATKGSDATEGPPADATHSDGSVGEPRRRRRGISIAIYETLTLARESFIVTVQDSGRSPLREIRPARDPR